MTSYTIEQDHFLINGVKTYEEYVNCPQKYKGLLMNARFIQAIFDDRNNVEQFQRFGKTFSAEENTNVLIRALPQWYKAGLRAFTVGMQGGGTCYTICSEEINNNPFAPDGTFIDPGYLERLKKLIAAADQQGMLVIVSMFYMGQIHRLQGNEAVMRVVKKVSNWLRDQKFTNVIIEIANEHNAKLYQNYSTLFDENGIVNLIKIARRESGGMAVGCSCTGSVYSEAIACESDVIFLHGNGTSRQVFYNQIQKAKQVKPVRPIVCNEDSQSLMNMQVAMDAGVSWGYYNNLSKQEPPVDWSILKGEDEFFAERMAENLGIKQSKFTDEQVYVLHGLEPEIERRGKRWIRLGAMYPEKIHKVEYYRNGELFETAYDAPFSVYYVNNWLQRPVENIEKGDIIEAVITLFDGTVISKTEKLE